MSQRTGVALVLAVLLGVAGCGQSVSHKKDSDAVAECVSALYGRLKLPDMLKLKREGSHVFDLRDGRKRVTGAVTIQGHPEIHSFTCVVSPDPSDTFRGLKIDSLRTDP